LAQQEDVIIQTLVGRRVVLVGHSRVNHDDVVLVISMEVVNKFAHHGQGESLRVDGEDSSKVHVIDIRPHGLKGNVGQAVVLDNFGNIEGILVSVSVNKYTYVSS
jgi:hypothetical protein